MSNKIDLTGQIFGKLAIISPATKILVGTRFRTTSLCKCECGEEKVVLNNKLRSGDVKSCGCLKNEIENLIGQIFGKLIVVRSAEPTIRKNGLRAGNSLCLCECGNKKIVSNKNLKSGSIKSCGCLRKYIEDLTGQQFGNFTVIRSLDPFVDNNGIRSGRSLCICELCGNLVARHNRDLKYGLIKSCGCIKIKFSAFEASARSVFVGYSDGDLDFYKDFLPMTQLSCFYCGANPTKIRNIFKNKPNSYAFGLNDGDFIFNGLDRVNSNVPHNKNNVVPCCFICNGAKSNLSIDIFKANILRLVNHTIVLSPEAHRKLSTHVDLSTLKNVDKYSFLTSVKAIFSNKRPYDDGDLSLELKYQLSQLNCYYCDRKPSNSYNITKGYKCSLFASNIEDFIYNGLDRTDNNLKHTYTNVVACCKHCNRSKRDLKFNDFIDWINRLKNHHEWCLDV